MQHTPQGVTGRRLGRRPVAFVRCALFVHAVLVLGDLPAAAGPTVAMIRSDDPALPAPVPAGARLDYDLHIRPMVQRVLEQAHLRDLVEAVEPGADGIVDVVCKVNIVHAEHVQGDVTDWRVVKAILETVHAWRPAARLTIAEGGVWFLPPGRTDLIALAPHVEVGDGFETAGYRALLQDPDLAGAELRIVDLAGIVDVDFTVVDAIVGMERARIAAAGGLPARRNIVVAGDDIVAVDFVG